MEVNVQKYNNRNEVPLEYRWDLTSFYKDDKDFNDSIKVCSEKIIELKEYVGCTKDANKLYEFLCKQINVVALWEDLYVYANLLVDQDLSVDENLVKKNKTESLYNEYNLNVSFFAPELLKLSKDEYDKLFIDCPSLEEYRADLDKTYREKEHIFD